MEAGLIQPFLLGGANAEIDVRYGPFVAAWSHGLSLDFEGSAITGAMKRQNVTLHVPYSTGFGVGVQHWVDGVNSFFDLRLEGKVHRFEASSGLGTKTEFSRYTTYTLGAAAYWTWMPFVRRTEALRGLELSTSVRFWPKVASTLSGGEVRSRRRRGGASRALESEGTAYRAVETSALSRAYRRWTGTSMRASASVRRGVARGR